uniref:Putative secreted protein n=1 Tax=Xenopsylla cheopis TaxID=163159 RepID=A0A6M2E3G6_XENCH
MGQGCILCHVPFGILAWGHSSHMNRVLDLQKRTIRAIVGVSAREHCKPLFAKYKITVPCEYILRQAIATHENRSNLISRRDIHDYNTWSSKDVVVLTYNLKTSQGSAIGCRIYNILPDVWKVENVQAFRKILLDKTCYSVNDFFTISFV